MILCFTDLPVWQLVVNCWQLQRKYSQEMQKRARCLGGQWVIFSLSWWSSLFPIDHLPPNICGHTSFNKRDHAGVLTLRALIEDSSPASRVIGHNLAPSNYTITLPSTTTPHICSLQDLKHPARWLGNSDLRPPCSQKPPFVSSSPLPKSFQLPIFGSFQGLGSRVGMLGGLGDSLYHLAGFTAAKSYFESTPSVPLQQFSCWCTERFEDKPQPPTDGEIQTNSKLGCSNSKNVRSPIRDLLEFPVI